LAPQASPTRGRSTRALENADAPSLHGSSRIRHTESVSDDRSRRDWSEFLPDAIPTKRERPQLEHWLDAIGLERGARVIDVGCGTGDITRTLLERGFEVVGVDINAAAVERCRRELPLARFYGRDLARSRPRTPGGSI
jgi:2-polyprenyl-3-methyl-5-hydroxy-6-metoxy-1,4-benzoquinol methylase